MTRFDPIDSSNGIWKYTPDYATAPQDELQEPLPVGRIVELGKKQIYESVPEIAKWISPCERDGHRYEHTVIGGTPYYFCKQCADLKDLRNMVIDAHKDSE